MKAAIWPRLIGWSGQNMSLAGGLQPRVTPDVPRMSIAHSWMLPSSSTNRSEPSPPVILKARTRNAAICALVSSSSGQNSSLVGGLQPRVMPAAARRLISSSKTTFSSSMKKFSSVSGRSSARWRNAAIWPRVTGSSGQNSVLAGGLQPRVMPCCASQTISPWKRWSSPTSSKLGGSTSSSSSGGTSSSSDGGSGSSSPSSSSSSGGTSSSSEGGSGSSSPSAGGSAAEMATTACWESTGLLRNSQSISPAPSAGTETVSPLSRE